MLDDINSYLEEFNTISLDEMKSVELMSRIDTKFIFSIKKLPNLLISIKDFYSVLTINNQRIQKYKSLYYDTDNRRFFLDHHNSRVNRNKVRFREYVGSGLVFLEVKFKNNKKKTIKKRIKVDSISDFLSKDQQNYVNGIIGKEMILKSQQWVNFTRITLVDKVNQERLTIDLDLTFSDKINSGSFEDIVIAEIKKKRGANSSKFSRIAKNNRILPFRVSKYCMSMINLNPDIKQNRFKEKLLLINKLKQL